MDVCTSIFGFSAPFAHILYAYTLLPVVFAQLGMHVHRRSVFWTKNKKKSNHRAWFAPGGKSEWELYLKRLPSQDWASQTAVRGGTKLHGSVARSCVTAFLVTTAPLEHYFTDNPRSCLAWFCTWGIGIRKKEHKRATLGQKPHKSLI